MRIIILGAEPFRNNMLNISDLESPLLIPYQGKAIYEHFLSKFSDCNLTIVIDKEAHLTKKLLNAKSNLSRVQIVEIERKSTGQFGPAHSLRSALERVPTSDEGILLMYADNIIELPEILDKIAEANSQVKGMAFSAKYRNSNRYSSFRLNEANKIIEYHDKGAHILVDSTIRMDLGVYYFKSLSILKSIIGAKKDQQIAECIVGFEDFISMDLKEWVDLGHWDLLSNPKNIGEARIFNSLSFNLNGCLIKSSENTQKIHNEIRFYKELPAEFVVDYPRIYTLEHQSDAYAIEYWPLKSLSEYIVFWNLVGAKVEESFYKINLKMQEYSRFSPANVMLEEKELVDFYNVKMSKGLVCTAPLIQEILESQTIFINGVEINGILKLRNRIDSIISDVSLAPIPGFLHGDLCFSNILISPSEGIMKFIDPRGSFLNSVNFGDVKYDLAKLFQGLGGYYDFVKAGKYSLIQKTPSSWELELYIPSMHFDRLADYEALLLNGFQQVKSAELYAMVAINFISFLPLHEDSSEDQLVFLLLALLLLNFGNCNSVIRVIA